jgi:hypothetical protein
VQRPYEVVQLLVTHLGPRQARVPLTVIALLLVIFSPLLLSRFLYGGLWSESGLQRVIIRRLLATLAIMWLGLCLVSATAEFPRCGFLRVCRLNV